MGRASSLFKSVLKCSSLSTLREINSEQIFSAKFCGGGQRSVGFPSAPSAQRDYRSQFFGEFGFFALPSRVRDGRALEKRPDLMGMCGRGQWTQLDVHESPNAGISVEASHALQAPRA